MGERTLRRLLIIAASGVVRWAKRKGVSAGSWLARMLARKPPMLVIVALANKNARVAWALIAKGGIYRLRPWPPKRFAGVRLSRCEEVQGQVWRNVGEAGSGEPGARVALRARASDVDLTLELPYGPAVMIVPQQRPAHGSTRSHAAPVLESSCTGGASTHGRAGYQSADARHGCSAHAGGPSWSRACLVDKHQTGWVEIEVPREPRLTRGDDVGPVLLGRVRGFFERDSASREEAPERADPG